MTYKYYVSYDENRDEFYAFVDSGAKAVKSLFIIEDTEDMCQYLKTDVMSHIDDIEGLETFLKQKNLLRSNDTLEMAEEILY